MFCGFIHLSFRLWVPQARLSISMDMDAQQGLALSKGWMPRQHRARVCRAILCLHA